MSLPFSLLLPAPGEAPVSPYYNARALRIADKRYAELVREYAERFPTLAAARADNRPIYLSRQNGKLKKDRIAAWSLLALANCESFGQCGTWCYATSNMFVFPGAVRVRWINYLYALDSSFLPEILPTIERLPSTWKTLRIHDSGDFFNRAYVEKWIEIAERLPSLRFYAYTKEFARLREPLQDFSRLPNTTVIQSYGGRDDRLIDPSLPHSRVFPSAAALEAAGFTDCSHSDLAAAYGSVIRVGLVAHSDRAKRNYRAVKAARIARSGSGSGLLQVSR